MNQNDFLPGRRQALSTAVAAAAALAAAWVRAQSFPDRQLTIVVPAPPGGTADIAARALVEPLGKALGQSIVIDNKGGGNGAVGAQAVLNAKPDGHSLLMAYSGFHCMSPHLVKLPYDPMKDLQAVCNVYSAPQVMVVRSSLENIKTAQDLIAYAKANPGKLNYGSSGNGSVQHIATELFKQLSGTFMTHIPYRGSGPTIVDLLSGQIDLTVTTAPSLMPHIQSGKFRPLLVAGPRRLTSYLMCLRAQSWGSRATRLTRGLRCTPTHRHLKHQSSAWPLRCKRSWRYKPLKTVPRRLAQRPITSTRKK